MYDNIITASGTADGIRAVGSLLDIQRNSFDVQKTGAVIKNYDSGYAGSQQYGSLAYFSENNWNQAESVYNVTKSSVTAQSRRAYLRRTQNAQWTCQWGGGTLKAAGECTLGWVGTGCEPPCARLAR